MNNINHYPSQHVYIEFDIQNRQTGKSTYLINELKDYLSLGYNAVLINHYPNDYFLKSSSYNTSGLEPYIFNVNQLKNKHIGNRNMFSFKHIHNDVLYLLIDELDFGSVDITESVLNIIEFNTINHIYDKINIHIKTSPNTKFHEWFIENGFRAKDLPNMNYKIKTEEKNNIYTGNKLCIFKNDSDDYFEYTCNSTQELDHITTLYFKLFNKCYTNINYTFEFNKYVDECEYINIM